MIQESFWQFFEEIFPHRILSAGTEFLAGSHTAAISPVVISPSNMSLMSKIDSFVQDLSYRSNVKWYIALLLDDTATAILLQCEGPLKIRAPVQTRNLYKFFLASTLSQMPNSSANKRLHRLRFFIHANKRYHDSKKTFIKILFV